MSRGLDRLLKDLLIGQFYPGDSVVHRLDPRTKILVTTAYVSVLFAVRGFTGYAVAALFTLLVAALARLPARLVLRSLKPVLVLVLLTVGLHAFTSGRDSIVIQAIGPLQVTDAGLWLGLSMGARITLLVLTSSLLTLTTTPIELTDGMESLMRPFARVGVPAHELAMMMTIALRFIPTLLEEADRIIKAQTARGGDLGGANVAARIRGLVPILVPLFVSAFRRAEELAMAMEARCYRGGEGRTRFRPLTWRTGDAWAGIAASIMVVTIVWLGR